MSKKNNTTFKLVKLFISPITNAGYLIFLFVYELLDILIINNIKDNKWLFLFYFLQYVLLFGFLFLVSIVNYVYLNCINASKRPSLIALFSLALVICYALSGPFWYYIAMIGSFMTNDPYNVINGLIINFILFSPLGIGLSFDIFNPFFIITLLYVFIPSVITNLFFVNLDYEVRVVLPNFNDKHNVFSFILSIGLCVSFICFSGVFFGFFNVINLSYFLNLELFFSMAFIFLKNCEKIELSNNATDLNISDNLYWFTDCCFYQTFDIDLYDSLLCPDLFRKSAFRI